MLLVVAVVGIAAMVVAALRTAGRKDAVRMLIGGFFLFGFPG